MKKVSLVILGLVMFCGFSFSEEFEGVVFAKFSYKDVDNSIKIILKGDKMKIIPEKQISGTNGYPIIDFGLKKGTFVFVDERYYMEIPLDPLIKNLEDSPMVFKEVEEGKYLNFNAKKFLFSDKDFIVEVIGTKDIRLGLNPFVGVQRLGNEGFIISKAAHWFYKNQICPLRIVVQNTKKDNIALLEIVSIEPQKVNNKEFEIPSGFKKYSDVMKERMMRNR